MAELIENGIVCLVFVVLGLTTAFGVIRFCEWIWSDERKVERKLKIEN